MVVRLLAAVLVCSFTGIAPAGAADGSIGHLFIDKNVKVYVADIANESSQPQITPESFKKALAESLVNRKSTSFQLVNDIAASDIQITGKIKQYQYLEKGPFKPSPGIETTLLDAAATATQNYVEMTVDYTVIDTKTGTVLWQGSVNEYIKKIMTPDESIPHIFDKVTRTFLALCFGKPHQAKKVQIPAAR